MNTYGNMIRSTDVRKNMNWLWVLLVLAGSVLVGITSSHSFLSILVLGLAGGTIALYISYTHPLLTIFLLVFFSLIAENLKYVSPLLDPRISLGPFNMRLWEPFVWGMAFSSGLKFLNNSNLQKILKHTPALVVLLVWLGLQVLRGMRVYGINALGEFRTYYSQLIVIPYIMVYGQTRAQRKRVFRTLLYLSFLFIPVAFIRGALAAETVFGVRWLSASSALALLYGLLSLFIARNHNLFNPGILVWLSLLVSGGFLLVFTAHRSVWLASVVALIGLYFLKEVRLSQQAQLLIIGVFVALLVFWGLFSVGQSPVVFLEDRLQAFTAPGSDNTASWRLELWRRSVSLIQKSPFLGKGFGSHFSFYLAYGNVVRTSPHNLYLTIGLQIGLIGLVLYLVFALGVYFSLLRASKWPKLSPSDAAIILTALIVFVAAHAYYIAYVFEFMTWLYMGLAISVLVNHSQTLVTGE
jgi:O-antigen ligase